MEMIKRSINKIVICTQIAAVCVLIMFWLQIYSMISFTISFKSYVIITIITAVGLPLVTYSQEFVKCYQINNDWVVVESSPETTITKSEEIKIIENYIPEVQDVKVLKNKIIIIEDYIPNEVKTETLKVEDFDLL